MYLLILYLKKKKKNNQHPAPQIKKDIFNFMIGPEIMALVK
jgi:hypothetical protein